MIGAGPLAAFLLAGSAAAGATTSSLPPCPESVQIEDKLSAPVAGWTADRSSEPHRLAGITLFDGKPALRASLVGDDQVGPGSSSVTTWTLARNRDYWLSCSYAGTNVTLTREIPADLRYCSATYSKIVRIAGLPELTRFACRALR